MRALIWVLGLVVLALPGTALAQDAVTSGEIRFSDGYVLGPLLPMDVPLDELGGGRPLRLTDVLTSVEQHHPPLEMLTARVRAAEGASLAADGGFDPVLAARGTLSALGYYEYGRVDVSLTQATPLYGASFIVGWRMGRAVDDDNRFPDYYGGDETLDGGELRAGVTVPLLRDGWIDSRRASITRAGLATDVARADLEAQRLTVGLAATQAYYRWLGAGRKLEIVLALLALAEDRDAQLAARVRAGAIAPIEHLENRRAVLDRRQSTVAALRGFEQAAIALSLYYRDEDGAPQRIDPSRYPGLSEDVVEMTLDEDEAVRLALAQRPERVRMRARTESAGVSRDLAENQLLPRLDVSLTGSVDVGTSSDDGDVNRLGPPVLAGLATLSVPLFFREGRGRLEAARADLDVLEAESELLGDTITLQVRDAFSAVRAAEAGLRLADESRRVAAAVAAAERARFEAGATTLLIVNIRESSAAQAAASWVDARVAVENAHALVQAVIAAPR